MTARLFAFEFAVIVAGVLVAHGLANWVQSRAAFAAMETAREKADRDVAFHYAVALGWKRAVPCLNDRMTLLMRQLGTAQPLDPEMLLRPAMEGGNLQLPSEQQSDLLTQRYGMDRAQDYWAASQNVTKLGNQVTEVINAWSGFALVDPGNGTVSERDRHEARLAAGRVKAALRGLEINADNIIGRAQALGLQSNSQDEFRPIRSCADMWSQRMTHPNRVDVSAADR